MKRPIRYLAFLAVLGALGWLTGNPLFYGFLGFIGFSNFPDVQMGTTFMKHVNQASRNALVVVAALFPAYAAFSALFVLPDTFYALAFAITFGLQVMVFSFSLYFLENPDRYKKR